MKAYFSTLARSIHQQLIMMGSSMPLSHAQQLLAASLGYSSLAAYQASPEEQSGVAESTYIILDLVGVASRANEISVGLQVKQVVDAFTKAIKAAPQLPRVFLTDREFLETEMTRFIEENILNDDTVLSVAAATNGYFNDVEIEMEQPSMTLAQSPGFWEVPFNGHVNLDQDPDKPFSGDVIKVTGVARIWKAGRVCLMDDIELDIEASIDDSHYDHNDVRSEPSISSYS